MTFISYAGLQNYSHASIVRIRSCQVASSSKACIKCMSNNVYFDENLSTAAGWRINRKLLIIFLNLDVAAGGMDACFLSLYIEFELYTG